METYNQPPSTAADDLIQAPSASADLLQAPSSSADVTVCYASTDPHSIRPIGFDVEGDNKVAIREVTCGCGKTRTVEAHYGTYCVYECKACKGEYHLDDVPGCEQISAKVRQYPDYQAYVAAIFEKSRIKKLLK